MKHTLEPIDDEKFIVNGVQIDMAVIKQRHASKTWPAHNPYIAVASLAGQAIMLNRGIEFKHSRLFHWLVVLYGYGLGIDERVFSVAPGEYPYYKVWDGFTGRWSAVLWIPMNEQYCPRWGREITRLGVGEKEKDG